MKKWMVIVFLAFLVLSGCGTNENTISDSQVSTPSNVVTKTYDITGIT
jgi:uncharacterized protein YcfL